MTFEIGISLFWICYGIVGICGFQFAIPSKFKHQAWTKSYIRFQGIAWLLLGVPWLLVSLFVPHHGNFFWTLALCPIPSLVYSLLGERKYSRLLKKEDTDTPPSV